MCQGGHCNGHSPMPKDQRIKMEAQFEAARIELEKLEQQRRMEESDEGLGHSGSSDDEKPVKTENMKEGENMELDENGKRKEDLYQCRYCDRTFCYLCHLKVHERVHTGEKPYKCTFCDCTFSQLGSLTVHMRIHTGEKPYECRICLKKFRHINSLRRHQRQVHRKTPAEVDAAPRGGDSIPQIGGGAMPGYQQRSMTPQPFHPYGVPAAAAAMRMANRQQPANQMPQMKSALEMRSAYAMGTALGGLNPYAFHQMQQMQARQMQAMQAQQQHLLKQQAAAQLQTTAAQPAARPVTNHSISAMINEAPKTLNKPKKHSFSISALVGEESEPESHETDDSCRIEEIVDVVSDQNSDVIEPASSPYSNGGNSDSADSGHNSSITNSTIIDDDLRRALTIDPTTLSVDEKQRLRRKLAEIALRNISSDSGIPSESASVSCY